MPGEIGVETQIKFDKHPNLFKKLEWWEERKESDMPEYLYSEVRKEYFRIERYDLKHAVAHPDYGDKKYNGFLNLPHTKPATESEYLTLNKK